MSTSRLFFLIAAYSQITACKIALNEDPGVTYEFTVYGFLFNSFQPSAIGSGLWL
ncbi:MAG: hypothetical protein KF862_05545 [Chitinophagaceae bacterium]|nr:hypothetical protein [Chitinophagaceae bacterium]